MIIKRIDLALSRLKQGFNSPRERQQFQNFTDTDFKVVKYPSNKHPRTQATSRVVPTHERTPGDRPRCLRQIKAYTHRDLRRRIQSIEVAVL